MDIQPTMAFLCTRVKAPDEDDWKKLIRLLNYLKDTIQLETTLEADNTNIIKWHVDASFAVHPDMRSHRGGAMTLGKGAIQTISTKQKINTKSSMEAELIGVDDVIGQILWTKWFLECQGYDAGEVLLYQDNTSTMFLEKYGKESSSKRTRHINIKYFFITDCLRRDQLKTEYCPTDEMDADFLSKPYKVENL